MAEKVFSTLDIYLSAYLKLQGMEPLLEVKNGKTVFNFEVTDRLYRLMGQFNGNIFVEVADFTTAIKTLRGKMLSAKSSVTEKGYAYGNFNR
ncbi:MAG: hypothetical protein C0399_03455 [Syntrophus sp. (in: bacteria)]|nr:hypothetical protein [Syntrophus sp. (in: bacteria)]